MASFLNHQSRRAEARRRAAYQALFDRVRVNSISEAEAYSAWLFLGQLEKQHGENPRELEDAYTYYATRVSHGAVQEWSSLNAGSKQMTKREFTHLYMGIGKGQIKYSKTMTAYRGQAQRERERLRGMAPSLRVVAKFLEQLALQLECGIPVLESLESLRENSSHQYLTQVASQIIDELAKHGTSLSVAMRHYPECFPSPVVALVRSGEKTGSLTHCLKRGAELMEKQAKFRARISGALTTPAIIVGLGSIIVFGLVKFIIPKFLEVYDQMDLDMPALSQFVISLVSIVDSIWFLLFLLVSTALVVYYREPLKQKLFNLGLETPVFGRWLRMGLAKEMCDILSDLQLSGVALHKSFRILADCTPYEAHRVQMLRAAENIQHEGSLSETLAQVTTLPPLVAVMARVGEESGALESLLRSLAKVLDDELDNSLNQLVTTLEPLALAVLGIGIAVLFVGLFLPIYGVIGNL